MKKRRIIHCKSQKEFNSVLEIFEKKGWKWNSNELPYEHKDDYWLGSDIYVEYDNHFTRSYNSRDYIFGNDCSNILSFEQFLKEETKISPMENKRAILCKTQEEFNGVLEIFEKKGWKWCNKENPTSLKSEWNKYNINTCLSYENNFTICNKESYVHDNYTILSFEQFLEEELKNNLTINKTMENDNLKKEFENLKNDLNKKLNEFENKINNNEKSCQEYQPGDWLYCSHEGRNVERVLFKFKEFKNNDYFYSELYQINECGFRCELLYDSILSNCSYYSSIVRATPEQIKEFLTIVAKHKGYKEGTRFKNIDGDDYINTIDECNFNYGSKEYSLRVVSPVEEWDDSCSNPAIYLNGKWAEIIEELVIPKIIIDGYKPIYDKKNNKVNIGCKEFLLEDFKAMIQLMNLNKEYAGITSSNIDCCFIIGENHIENSDNSKQKLTRIQIEELMKLFKENDNKTN